MKKPLRLQKEMLRDAAREKGRKAAQRVFSRAICRGLRALKLDPFDVKPILNPVDFVVFKGMNEKDEVSNIMFLSREYHCPPLNLLRRQVRQAVAGRKYDWEVARINERGRISFE